MQARFTGSQSRFRFRPNFSLNAATAHRACDFPVLKEKHFRTTLLRSRATCMCHGGNDDTLAAVVSLIDQSVQLALRNGGHRNLCFVVRVVAGESTLPRLKYKGLLRAGASPSS